MALLEKVAVLVSVVAISLSVSGCGGGGGGGGGNPPTPAPPTPPPPPQDICRADQGQCSKCLDHKCLSCNTGYVKDDGVPGGRCVSSCIGTPAPSPPPKPSSPFALNGKAWPQMCLNASEAHFFGIGDWGGVGEPGHTWTNPGRCEGRRLKESDSSSNVSFLGSKAEGVRPCMDADHWAQKYVAQVMGKLAPTVNPDYVLNVGDNFYPGGITNKCGEGGATPSGQWKTQFDDVYGIYPDLKGKPWFSVMGNHDYGGIGFLMGWDEQIFTTWSRNDWVMPGQYWSRRVQYADFAVEYFFLESNIIDARNPGDKNHYICQGSGQCYGIDSAGCHDMFEKAWAASKQMLEAGLEASTAEWHIIVTHYPGPDITSDAQIAAMNKKYGIDLIFTGHQHQQLTAYDNGMQYIISGGGGGVTTDSGAHADGHDDAYGFVDFKINRTHLKYDMYTWGGNSRDPVQEEIYKSVTLESHKYNTTKQKQLVREREISV